MIFLNWTTGQAPVVDGGMQDHNSSDFSIGPSLKQSQFKDDAIFPKRQTS